MTSTISVLMPVYNGEKHLCEAIDSILNQTYRDFEFLIINDGSTDKSVEIIQQYEDSRINLIHNKENMGLIYTLNKGLDLANGKYIARMDADDISLPDRLRTQVHFMDTHKDIGICGSWVEAFGGRENIIWKYPIDSAEIHCQLLFNCDVIAHPSTILRKNVLIEHNLKYRNEFAYAEDWAFWLEASRYTKIINIGKILLRYRLHVSNVNRVHQKEQNQTIRKIIKKYLSELDVDANPEEIEMHRWINLFNIDISTINKYEEWLCRLQKANEKRQIYPEPSFSIYLIVNWFNLLLRARGSGMWCIKRYVKSQFLNKYLLSKRKFESFYRILKFLVRCLIIREFRVHRNTDK